MYQTGEMPRKFLGFIATVYYNIYVGWRPPLTKVWKQKRKHISIDIVGTNPKQAKTDIEGHGWEALAAK